jgi:plastocyanin
VPSIRDAAPGRPSGRPGVLVWGLVAALSLGGCDAVGGGDTIALDSASVSIDGSVHELRISGAAATDTLDPATLEVEVGDAVRFVVEDRRPHALTFTEDRLETPVREYLDRTGQLRGPPLVNQGASWVVILEDAPPGSYPFHCRSHDASGEITVTSGG